MLHTNLQRSVVKASVTCMRGKPENLTRFHVAMSVSGQGGMML